MFAGGLAATLLVSASALPAPAGAQVLYESDVFVGGEEGPEGTPNFRIPGMIATPAGVLLAFAEGRRGGSDPGQPGTIDLVMKRSADGGRSWSPLVVIDRDDRADFANPTPLFDHVTGTAFIVYDQFPDLCASNEDCVEPGNDPDPEGRNQVVWFRTSRDGGLTWSERRQIMKPLRGPDGMYLRTGSVGPGSGIQLTRQADAALDGRLVVPARRGGAPAIDAPRVSVEPFVYFSDDHGASWHAGAPTPGPSANEAEVVELASGALLLDGRQDRGEVRRRHVSVDGGATWSADVGSDITITRVDASLIRYPAGKDDAGEDRIIFVGPAGDPPGSGAGRRFLSVWISRDEARKFTGPIVVGGEYGAYSVAQPLPNGRLAILYEAAPDTLIRLIVLDLDALEGAR